MGMLLDGLNNVLSYAAINVDDSWPWVFFLRAQALAGLGRTDEAQADLRQAQELEPVDELRQEIEALLLQLGVN